MCLNWTLIISLDYIKRRFFVVANGLNTIFFCSLHTQISLWMDGLKTSWRNFQCYFIRLDFKEMLVDVKRNLIFLVCSRYFSCSRWYKIIKFKNEIEGRQKIKWKKRLQLRVGIFLMTKREGIDSPSCYWRLILRKSSDPLIRLVHANFRVLWQWQCWRPQQLEVGVV